MASFNVPTVSASSFTLTLADLKERIRRAVARENETEYDAYWTPEMTTQAIEQALAWCRPIGVRSELSAVAGSGSTATAEWTVAAKLMRLDAVNVTSTFGGLSGISQDVPVGTVEQTMAPDGSAILIFPQVIPSGSVVKVMGLWQYALPIDDADLVPWAYPDLLVAASCAELYRLALHHGMTSDQMDTVGAEGSWRQQATDLKFAIMSTLGFAPPEEESKPKPKAKGKGR